MSNKKEQLIKFINSRDFYPTCMLLENKLDNYKYLCECKLCRCCIRINDDYDYILENLEIKSYKFKILLFSTLYHNCHNKTDTIRTYCAEYCNSNDLFQCRDEIGYRIKELHNEELESKNKTLTTELLERIDKDNDEIKKTMKSLAQQVAYLGDMVKMLMTYMDDYHKEEGTL